MINVCASGHDEIAYEGREQCPACVLMTRIQDKDDEISKLNEEVEDLSNRLAEET